MTGHVNPDVLLHHDDAGAHAVQHTRKEAYLVAIVFSFSISTQAHLQAHLITQAPFWASVSSVQHTMLRSAAPCLRRFGRTDGNTLHKRTFADGKAL